MEVTKGDLFNKIELTGIPPKAVSRYLKIIQLLIAKGALDVKDGSTTLHWDEGFLNKIETKSVAFDRAIPPRYNDKI